MFTAQTHSWSESAVWEPNEESHYLDEYLDLLSRIYLNTENNNDKRSTQSGSSKISDTRQHNIFDTWTKRNHSPWHHDEEYDLHASNQVPSAAEPATYRVSVRKKIYRY